MSAADTHVQPIEACSGKVNGEQFVLHPTEILSKDHPIVRAYPHFFRPVEGGRERPPVEQATAAPGEKRGPGRPRKAAATQ